jgi:DNA repair photolyase
MLETSRKITSGTKEWADYNVNCVKGCSNDCRYCYAKMIAKRFGRKTDETWKNMEINTKAVEKSYKKYHGRVMFPSSHDITEKPEIIEACLKVLTKLLIADNEVLITTKPSINVTKKIITKFNDYKKNIQFRFTIGTKNNQTLSFWEPNAPNYHERKKALQYAHTHGYKTSISIEPLLDHNPTPMITELDPYVSESIWIGPMNYIKKNNIPEEQLPYYNEIREINQKQNLEKIYENLKNHQKIRFKDSFLNKIKK